jgi:hypothetical protein
MSRTVLALLAAACTVASGIAAEVHGVMTGVMVACAALAAGTAAYASSDQKKVNVSDKRKSRDLLVPGWSPTPDLIKKKMNSIKG